MKVNFKKIIAGSLFCGLGFLCQAQLPDGSLAPNFTTTDLDGNQHTLNNYLADGKIVILDFFNNLCSPCWAYHKSLVLDDLYHTYGPDGTDQIMVFFINGQFMDDDPAIQGVGPYTLGDWTANTPYPVIGSGNGGSGDGADIADTYMVQGYPQLYRICPNGLGGGTSTTIYPMQHAAFVANIEQGCSTTLSDVSDHVLLNDAELNLCMTTQDEPQFELENMGTNTVTSATIVLYENGTQIATQNFNGSLQPWQSQTITFPVTDLNFSDVYTAKATLVNSNPTFSVALATADLNVNEVNALATTQEITIQINTDHYASDITWELRDDNGTLIASGGPYADLPQGVWEQAQPPVTATIGANNCFEFTIFDLAGNGIPGALDRYTITDANGNQLVVSSEINFTDERSEYFKSGILSLGEKKSNELAIYPNPTTDIVHVSTQATGECVIYLLDATGRIVMEKTVETVSGKVDTLLDLSSLSSGTYIVSIHSNDTVYMDQLIKR